MKKLLLLFILICLFEKIYAQTYTMSTTTVTTCSGTFYDSGGSAGNYGNSESFTETFCSGTTQSLQFVFNSFDTKNAQDNLVIYNGPNTASPVIGTYSATTSPGTITSSGTCLTFVWTSNANGVLTGWDATISCVATPTNNDDCIGAIPITPATSCSYTTFSNDGATASAGVPAPGCASYSGGDVWFSAVVPADGHLIFDTQTGTITDGGMAIYSGTCAALTLIECNDDGSTNGLMPMINNGGLTPGSTVYIRFWEYGGDVFGTFGLCVYDPAPTCNDGIQNQGETGIDCGGPCPACPVIPGCGTNPAASNFCTTPTPICNLNGFCGNTSATYTVDASSNLSALFCGSIENNSWLTFVADATTATLNITVSNCVYDWGIQMEIFGTTDCNTFVSYSNCWNPGVMQNGTISATGLTIGQTYYLMIDGWAGDNCDYIISANNGVFTVDAGNDVTICAGQSTTLNGSGGATYSWTPTTGLSNPNIANPVATPSATTTYTLTCTGGSTACPGTNTDAVVVTVNSVIPTASSNSPICSGQTLNLTSTPTGATSYSWSGPNSFSSNVQNPTLTAVTPAASGTYTVTVTNAGCTATATTNVSISASAAITASSNSPVCSGTALNLTSTAGGTNYSWTGPNSFASAVQNPTIASATPAATGIYTVTITFTGGCTGSSTVSVTVNSSLTVTPTATPATICNGASSSLSATSSVVGTTYSWMPGSLSGTPVSVTPGSTTTYTVTGTASGCTGSATVTVTVNLNPVVTPTATLATICNGTSSSLSAISSVVGTTYSWMPGSMAGTPVSVTPGSTTTYTVTGTASGCTGSATVTVSVNPNPVVTPTATPATICNGASSSLSATSSVGGTTYTWMPGSLSGTPVSVTPGSTTTYTVTGTASGCTGSATITVTVNSNPVLTPTATPTTICNGVLSSLSVSSSVAGTNYSWMPGSMAGTPVSVTPGSTTTYTVTGTASGCTGSATVTVTVNPNPVITPTATPTTICNGASSSLSATSSVVGTTFSWMPGSLAGTPVSVTPGSTTTYTVTGTASGCTGSATVTVTVNPNPVVTPTATPATICNGASSSLSATSSVVGTTYSWMPGSMAGTPVSVTPGSTTAYTVTGTASGCTGSATVTITVNPNPVLTPTATPATICNGTSSSLSVTSSVVGTTYSWMPGSMAGTPVSVTPGSTTIYTVTGTASGCTGSATVTVTVNPNPVVTPTATPATICSGTSASLSATSSIVGTTYSWMPGSLAGTPVSVTPGSTTTYTVTGTASGCTGSATVTVTVNPLPTVTVPTNIVICNNGSVAATNFVSNPAGGTFAWTNSNTAIGLAANGTGNIPTFIATNTTTAAITATITVTPTSNACIGTPSTYTITVNPTDNPAFNYTPSTMCQTGTDQSAIITGGASGIFSATPAGLVFLNTATGLIDVSASTINTYTVTFTTSGACPSSSTATVNITLAPSATFNYAGPYCPDGIDPSPTFALGASAGVFTATPAGLVFVSTATGQVDLSASTPSTYTVTNSIAAAGGCTSAIATNTITINPTPTVTVPANIVVCNNGAIATTAFISTPAGGTFVWTNSNTAIGLAANGTGDITGFTATNTSTAPITATISVTPTVNACVGISSTYTITVNPTPNVTVPANIVVCNGAAIAGTAFTSTTAGTTYTWTNSNTAIGIGANGAGNIAGFTATNTTTAPITATITVTPTANTCVGTSSTYTITVNPTPLVTIPANIVVCNGAAVTATAFSSTTAGATYTWTNSNTAIGLATNGTGDINGFNATNTTTAPITATITVTPAANNCVGTSSTYTITVNPTPTVSEPANIIVCNGGAVAGTTFTSSTPGTTFAWTNSNTTIGIAANGNGDIAGFMATNTTTTAVTATITVSPTANACTGVSSSYTITVNPTPVVTVTTNITVCNGAAVATTLFTSTTPGATYTWTNSNTTIGLSANGTGNITGFNAVNTSSAPITATITITPSANGCLGMSSTYTITVNPTPVVTIPGNVNVCTGTIIPSATLTSTTPGATFTWTNSNPAIGLAANGTGSIPAFTATNTNTSPIVASISVTPSANGCTGTSASYTITVNPIPVITFTAMPTLCPTSPSFILNQASPPGGTYSGIGVVGNTFNPDVAGIGTQTITYTYTNPTSGCSNTNTAQITVTNGLSISVNPSDTSICHGSNVILTANGAANFIWSPSAGLNISTGTVVIANPVTSTIYTVTGSNPDGCMGVNTVSVNYYDSTAVSIFAVPDNGCIPLDVTFNYVPASIIADSTWHWYFDDASSGNNTSQDSVGHHYYQQAGNYTVTFSALDIHGCHITATTTVNGYPVPNAGFYYNPGLGIAGTEAINFADISTNAFYWLWDFGDPASNNDNNSNLVNPTHMYADSGSYTVQLIVISNHNCSDTAYHIIEVDPGMIIWVPNAFTPNSDNKNDVFKPMITGIDRSTYQILIFDRWGKQVFVSNDLDLGWDGTLNGKNFEMGVFTYIITFNEYDGVKHKYVGAVTLIR